MKQEKTIEQKIRDAISYIGVNRKTSGGWKSEITDPVIHEIIKIIDEELIPKDLKPELDHITGFNVSLAEYGAFINYLSNIRNRQQRDKLYGKGGE